MILKFILNLVNDWRALRIFRRHYGDLSLICVATQEGMMYECTIFQNAISTDVDPAKAILKAFKKWQLQH